MQVIILAAGLGKRLRPLTCSFPKAMVKVRGIPILEHTLFKYLQLGIPEEDIYVVVGYLGKIIENYLLEKYPKINIIYNPNYENTNNMYSLYLALNSLKKPNTSILINNGDCIYDKEILSYVIKDRTPNIIVCDRSKYSMESMKIKVKDNRVISISKKISSRDAYAVSIDLYKLSPSASSLLKEIIHTYLKKSVTDWMEEAIQILLSKIPFYPLDIAGYKWAEIDTLEDLLYAERLFSSFDLSKKKAFILDMDGTVYIGNKPIKGTINFINSFNNQFEFYFVTNNTSNSKEYYLYKLKHFGIKNISKENILTPVDSLVTYLKKEGISKIYCLGTDSLRLELTKYGFCCIEDYNPNQVEAVVVGYDTELTYDKLKVATLLLHNKKIRFFATHEDILCPTEDGLVPDAGSILSLLFSATGRKPEKLFGKPSAEIVTPLLERFKKEEIVFVGDRLYTDKKLAERVGIDFILVLSGETTLIDLQKEKKYPSLVLKDLGDLLKPISNK